MFVKPDGDTELARVVDVVMTRAKRIYILIIKVNKLFSFFSSRCFLKEIENMYSVFLSSYRNTRESLGELEKNVETLARGSCSHSISRSPKLPLEWYSIETRYLFSIPLILSKMNPNHTRRKIVKIKPCC